MFQRTKNIDMAFKTIRLYSLVVILLMGAITIYTVYKSFSAEENRREQVLVLPAGKVIEAVSSSRRENIPVEARDHVKTFHEYFFTLIPDDKAIEATITRALYLADGSAKRQYDNLRESNYYSSLISGNVSQEITVDSVEVNTTGHPFYFTCRAMQKLTRSTSVVTRELVTEGFLRMIPRSDNNPHGFLIEKWKILSNKDIAVKKR